MRKEAAESSEASSVRETDALLIKELMEGTEGREEDGLLFT